MGCGVWAGKAAKFKVGFRDIDLKELFRRSRGAIPLPRPIREDLHSCPLFVTFGKNSHLWQEETTLYMRAFPLWFYFTYFLFHNFYYIKSRTYFLFPLCPYNFFKGKGETKITLSIHGGAKRRIHFPLKTEGHSSCLLEDLFFSLFLIFYFLSWRFVVAVVFFFSFGVLDEIRSSVWTIFVIDI